MVFPALARSCAVLAAAAALQVPGAIGRKPAPAPFEWVQSAPETQGMAPEALSSLNAALAAAKTAALLVVRNDRIVHEWYADGRSASARHYTASMAKALVGGLAAAVALSDNRLTLDDPAARFVPEWAGDARRSRITLRHLGSHTSGVEDAEADGIPHEKLTGWKGDFWKRLPPPGDPFTIARDRSPVLFDPGTQFHYSNPGIAMLSYAITSALRDAPQRDLRTLLRDRVMQPIGVADGDWAIGYGMTQTVDGLPLVAPWGGGNYTARAVARVGRLLLRGGTWNEKELLDAAAVRAVTTDAGTPGHGGIGWWSNAEGRYPRLPRDAYWGSGAGHQVIVVIPSLDLIAVRNGGSMGEGIDHHDVLNARLFEPLVAAVRPRAPSPQPDPPYAGSPVIAAIDWAGPETILRAARGSDNWPVTWGDDDALYAAYGDGHGFEPRVPVKLSMGFARVLGGPADFSGTNIRSASGETLGDGAKGRKASGILMVDGVLYLWVRNAGNAQLAWSRDRGRTWTWGRWTLTTSFGAPTFLNFGRNYEGARDEFVYVYSHDADSAYAAADRMVLARVRKDRIRDRQAYEFFRAIDEGGSPSWTRDISARGAVFTHPGRCYRSGVTYNAGLRRYLWSQTLPGDDARFRGGFGIYDAPEPWGPWTTAYLAPEWDVGPGESSSLPAKWMSADGRTVHLVFSGDDAFSVRRGAITLR